jgi:ankyrin repeat protein
MITPDNSYFLAEAIRNSNYDECVHLINLGADVNYVIKTEKKYTLLHISVIYNNLEITKLLVENGADILAETIDGERPSHMSRYKKNFADYFRQKEQEREEMKMWFKRATQDNN